MDIIKKNIDLEVRLIEDLPDMTRLSRGKLLLAMEEMNAHLIVLDALSITGAI